jgi:hypothetical protein
MHLYFLSYNIYYRSTPPNTPQRQQAHDNHIMNSLELQWIPSQPAVVDMPYNGCSFMLTQGIAAQLAALPQTPAQPARGRGCAHWRGRGWDVAPQNPFMGLPLNELLQCAEQLQYWSLEISSNYHQFTSYCSVSTKCSHHVTRHLKCSLNLVFISRQSVKNYPIWYSGDWCAQNLYKKHTNNPT